MAAILQYPRSKKVLSLLFLLSLNLFFIPNTFAGNCADWQLVMAQSEIERMPQSGKTVIVQPFTDFTKSGGDDWMTLGLRDYVADLLRSSSSLRVFAGNLALHSGLSDGPDFMVNGTFQHTGNNMRIFIRLSDGKTGQLIAQPEASFPYPDNKDFFTKIADATKTAMQAMQVNSDSKRFDAIKNATSSTRAYENFAKGRQALETYHTDKLEAASLFFTDAKRIDIKSPLGYQGLAALYEFTAISQKQRNENYSSVLQRLEAELINLKRSTKFVNPVFGYVQNKPVKKESNNIKLDNRFLAEEVAYSEGLSAAQAAKWQEAAAALKRATELVPEDALAWYHLSRMQSKLGNEQEAQKILQKAYAINSCVEQ